MKEEEMEMRNLLHEKVKEWLEELSKVYWEEISPDMGEVLYRSELINLSGDRGVSIELSDSMVHNNFHIEVLSYLDDALQDYASPTERIAREIYMMERGTGKGEKVSTGSWREKISHYKPLWLDEVEKIPHQEWWNDLISDLSNKIAEDLSGRFFSAVGKFFASVIVDYYIFESIIPTLETFERNLLYYLESLVDEIVRSELPQQEKEKVTIQFKQVKESLPLLWVEYINPLTDSDYWYDVIFGAVGPNSPNWLLSNYKIEVLSLVGEFLESVRGIKFKGVPPRPEAVQRKEESLVDMTITGHEDVAMEGARQFADKIDIYLENVENFLEAEGYGFPTEDIQMDLREIYEVLDSPPPNMRVWEYYKSSFNELLKRAVNPETLSQHFFDYVKKGIEGIDDEEYLDWIEELMREEEERMEKHLEGRTKRKLRKEDKGEISPVAVWEKLVEGDDKMLKDISKFLAKLFFLFLHDWFNWEILGWLLALKLGFSPQQIQRYPELGWFAKAVTSYILIRSDDRNTRLLGRALLYHTEIPPEHVYVKVGGDFLPAVVDHYRRSAKHQPVLKELRKILELLAES